MIIHSFQTFPTLESLKTNLCTVTKTTARNFLKSKLSYNLATDKRIRRGNKFAIPYIEEETEENKFLNNKPKKLKHHIKKEENKALLDQDDDKRRINCGSYTEPVKDTTFPKPLTFEIGVPDDKDYVPYISTADERIIPPWRTEYGENKETEIKDGDLFSFDKEVMPLVAVIMSKTLELARKEVLEEEEIAEMIRQQNHFNKLTQEERANNARHEEEESKRIAKIKETREAHNKMKETKVHHQQLLYSRVVAKQYNKNLRQTALSQLVTKGFFCRKTDIDFFNQQRDYLLSEAENKAVIDYQLVDKLAERAREKRLDQVLSKHEEAVRKEYLRRADLKRKYEEKLRNEEKEKELKMIRKAKQREERRIENIKKHVRANYLEKAQHIDDIKEVDFLDIDANGQTSNHGTFINSFRYWWYIGTTHSVQRVHR